jgi:hypothetical protein
VEVGHCARPNSAWPECYRTVQFGRWCLGRACIVANSTHGAGPWKLEPGRLLLPISCLLEAIVKFKRRRCKPAAVPREWLLSRQGMNLNRSALAKEASVD